MKIQQVFTRMFGHKNGCHDSCPSSMGPVLIPRMGPADSYAVQEYGIPVMPMGPANPHAVPGYVISAPRMGPSEHVTEQEMGSNIDRICEMFKQLDNERAEHQHQLHIQQQIIQQRQSVEDEMLSAYSEYYHSNTR